MNNWKEYLERKFSDTSLYEIEDKTDLNSSGFYTIKSKTNQTIIDFIWPDEDWYTIEDIQFYSKSANGWSGEFDNLEFNSFNPRSVSYVDEWLSIPINKGWISEEFYINEKLFKAVSYVNDQHKKGKRLLVDFNFGCLGLILFPVTFILNFALDKGLLGEKKTIVVEPIEMST
ncbi:hypothetical protein [Pontibacter populi]|uniref:Uncharacterized protein n=1 Tax=Pontibacter populi TaxID=890055 RepID=A0ABV1RWL6_9BACT